jgi:hypothetical protein
VFHARNYIYVKIKIKREDRREKKERRDIIG